MINPRVAAICEEFSIEIISGLAYPGPRQTRAVGTMDRILRKQGEDHFRWVMMTIAETTNNYGHIDENLLMAMSELVRDCQHIIDERPSEWLEAFDKIEVGKIQWAMRKKRHQPDKIYGALMAHIVKAFEATASQPDLLERASA